MLGYEAEKRLTVVMCTLPNGGVRRSYGNLWYPLRESFKYLIYLRMKDTTFSKYLGIQMKYTCVSPIIIWKTYVDLTNEEIVGTL